MSAHNDSSGGEVTNPFTRLSRFLHTGLWQQDLRRLPPAKRFFTGLLRVLAHLFVSASQNLAGLQAAGLTMLTVLALVPMLALATAIAKSLGYADKLDASLVEWQGRFPQDVEPAFDWLRKHIAEVNFGALGLVGSVIVLWSGLLLFTRVEQALNKVWRTRRRRAWYRRVSDFVTLIVVVPPMLLLAFAASSLLGGLAMSSWLREQAPWLGWLYHAGLGFVPHVLAWCAFTALYKIMPSARVGWRSAMAGGVVAGSTLVVLHGIYLRCNVGVANANAVYLTFAALPLLLVYVQLFWSVVLGGAEICYAVQNLGTLHSLERLPPASPAVQRRLAWHLVTAAGQRFRSGRQGVEPSAVCAQLDVPGEWLERVADQLVAGGVLVQVEGGDELLMPARPPEQLDMQAVQAALDGPDDEFLARVRLPASAEQELGSADSAAAAVLSKLGF
ncbi:MAG TPA: YihY/virulence factor BrkB family protein [Planctomycetota bacterium]|nr:YihY/virulence factor BrkB family protein [Planctomycetota bacterium]